MVCPNGPKELCRFVCLCAPVTGSCECFLWIGRFTRNKRGPADGAQRVDNEHGRGNVSGRIVDSWDMGDSIALRIVRIVVCSLNSLSCLFMMGVAAMARYRSPLEQSRGHSSNHGERNLPLLRYLAYFSIPELTRSVLVIWDSVSTADNSAGCQVVGALVLYSFEASWLWMIAIANLLRRQLCTSTRLEAVVAYERTTHALCWGLPLIIVVPLLAIGSFGASGVPLVACDWREDEPAVVVIGTYIPLWIALVFNAGCFGVVHLHLRRLRQRLEDAHNDADTMRARTRLWPRMLAYNCAFFLSQAPWSIFYTVLHTGQSKKQSTEIWLLLLLFLLVDLHGFFNSVLYCSMDYSELTSLCQSLVVLRQSLVARSIGALSHLGSGMGSGMGSGSGISSKALSQRGTSLKGQGCMRASSPASKAKGTALVHIAYSLGEEL